jgi:Flp pilus assembly protein TadB
LAVPEQREHQRLKAEPGVIQLLLPGQPLLLLAAVVAAYAIAHYKTELLVVLVVAVLLFQGPVLVVQERRGKETLVVLVHLPHQITMVVAAAVQGL